MPQRIRDVSLPARVARLEERLEQLQRTGWERDELPLYATGYSAMPFSDATTFSTLLENTFAPRTASLALGLTAVGDQVAGVNTGGEWQVLLAGAVVWSGTVPANFTVQYPVATLDLLPYRGATELLIQIQTRRTAGANTGGRNGNGGSIGLSPRFARFA
ncbi:hypothetical protein [Streptomyces sp. or3]|uniref:hypothetical protein n=1 Tax=Streptomyces sp. or3 TaxID=1828020 RepID=UPI000BFBB8A6|nr:hypothetical protein [Streptomyces sp. or3]